MLAILTYRKEAQKYKH